MAHGLQNAEQPLLSLDAHLRVHQRCTAFEAAWAAVKRPEMAPPEIASFIQEARGAERDELIKELFLLDLEFRARSQTELGREAYLAKLPGCEQLIHNALAERRCEEGVTDTAAGNSTADERSQQPPVPAGGAAVSGQASRAEDRQPDVPCQPADAARTTTAPPPPTPADAVRVGRYILLERLGTGGMGAVYKAWHPLLKRYVAIKLIRPELTSNPVAVQRFLGEIEAVGRIDHPHIVAAHDAGVEGGRYHLVLELVEGRPVSQLLTVLGQWPIPEACEVVRQAALGLQKVHECGMVHRDVKPSNLMLTPDGTVKVLDLGLSQLQPHWPGTHETHPGDMLGTADYMAPEQADDSHNVDIRADIYGLGCTLYHLLTGRAPFGDAQHKDFVSKLAAHRQEPVPSMGHFRSDVTADLAEVLDRMLAKAPDDRYRTPAEVTRDLQAFVSRSDLSRLCQTTPRVASESSQQPRIGEHHVAASTAPNRQVSADRRGIQSGVRPIHHARPWVMVACAAAVLFAAVAGVIYVATDRGTLEITTSDPNVQVVVTQNGREVTIVDVKTRSTVKLRTGTYDLEGQAANAGVQVTPSQIVLRRGQTVVAQIVLRDASGETPKAGADGSLDREIAEFALKSGGWVTLTPGADVKQLQDLPDGPIAVDKMCTWSDTPLPDLAAKLAQLKSLRGVYLIGTPFSDGELAQLAAQSRLHWLYLTRNKITDKGVGLINAFSNLETLSLTGNIITDEGVRSLRSMKELTALYLIDTRVTDGSLPAIVRFRKLQKLGLDNDAISDSGIGNLAQLPELTVLSLAGTNITDASVPLLVSIKTLKELDVRGTLITENGIKEVRSKLPGCKIR